MRHDTAASRPALAARGLIAALALAGSLLAAPGCRAGGASDSVSVVPGSGEPVTVAVEIAATPQARELGLMYRDSLGPASGMLFVFPEKASQAFWMRNTRIPLDIMFLDDDGRIVRIHRRTTPFSEAGLPSGAPVRFVLEVEGGFSEKHGVKEGDRVDLGRLATTPAH